MYDPNNWSRQTYEWDEEINGVKVHRKRRETSEEYGDRIRRLGRMRALGLEYEEARKRGISVEEYRRRQARLPKGTTGIDDMVNNFSKKHRKGIEKTKSMIAWIVFIGFILLFFSFFSACERMIR